MAFELIKEAEQGWSKNKRTDKIELLLKGVPFMDGEPPWDNLLVQQKFAA